MAELKVKISELNQGTPLSTDIIPYVDLVSGETKKALKSELKGDKGDAATVDAGTTTTLAAGQNATVTNVGTPSAAIFNFAIPQGIQGITGADGADGACVESVAFVGNDMVFTLDDASTVTITNAKVDLKGDKGDTGAKITSASFVGDDLVFVLDDTSTVTITGAKTNLKGDTGLTGETGATGKGITSITKTGTVGLVDTYTITYTDETTATFDVTNGEDGADGTNGTNGTDGEDGISFIWKGAYVAETAYTPNDVVSYNGSTYICILESTGNLPTNATYWSLMAQKGVDGLGSGDMLASVYDPANGARQVAFNNELHDAVTVTDTDEIDLTLTGQAIKADIKTGSVAKSKLDSSVQTSLGKADTAIQDISGKQDTLGFTPENVDNKENTTIDTSTTKYPTVNLLKTVKDIADAKMSNPMTTAGDTIYGGASGVPTRLGVGTAGQVLTVNSGATAPEWQSGVTASSTTTLTNKRITKRVSSETSTSTLTPNSDSYDVVKLTAQAAALTIAAPTGTPTDGQPLLIQIVDNGTARALTWNSAFVAMGAALPTTTTISKILQVGCIWDAGTSKWLASNIQQV